MEKEKECEKQIYYMSDLESSEDILESNILLLFYNKEERGQTGIRELLSRDHSLDKIIVFSEIDDLGEVKKALEPLVAGIEMEIVTHIHNQQSFLLALRNIEEIEQNKKVAIDISCCHLPNLFIMMKYIKMKGYCGDLYIINTIPYDYNFGEYPFNDYKTYDGDLLVREVIGFAGNDIVDDDCELILFLGFERALALKTIEEITHSKVRTISLMPAYYQKYKDVSIVNNGFLGDESGNRQYVPADNPFEVYNYLEETINTEASVSIAPLSTKPVSLGICMFALRHGNVRIVFPEPTGYRRDISTSYFISNVYRITIP